MRKGTHAGTVLMTEGNARRQIIGFALPVFIGYFFQQLYNTVDSLIVGNYLGKEALAAVTSTSAYVYLVTGFFLGFATGAGIVIARHIGACDAVQTEKSVHTAAALGLVMSAAMTAAGILISPMILRLLGTPADVFDRANLYLRIYFAGSAFLVMYNVFVGILQAAGDSRYPLMCLVISSLVNIVLDLVFVTVLKMDVDGAALATVIAEALSMVLVAVRLLRSKENIRLRPSRLAFDGENLRMIVRYGFPTAMQGCVIDLSNMLIQSYINFFGSTAVAGIGASLKIEGFAFLPVTAFSMALTTFISQNMGAKKPERVRAGVRFGLACALGMLAAIGALTFAAAPWLIGLFGSDPGIVDYGVLRSRVCAPFFCLVGFSHVASAIMRGLGKPATPMIVMLACWCGVRLLILFTIGQMVRDVRLVFWIYPFTWTLSTIVYVLKMRRMRLLRGTGGLRI